MNPVIRAKLDLIIAVTAFGTIGIFVRYIALPSSIIALVRGAVGAAFLWLLLRWKKTPFQREALRSHLKLLVLSGVIMSFNWITLFEAYNYTTVATATLCYYMAPVFVTLASPFLFHERLTARVKELRAQSLTISSQRMIATRQSEIIRELEERGIPLDELVSPPKIIDK